jgi:hypothetical protein
VETVPGPLLLEYKKTAPYPTWDKSCTPAIPPKLTSWKTSARFTRHHACPMDNGWVPVGIYLVSRSSRPRKSIRPAAPRSDSTTRSSLKGLLCRLLLFLKGLLLFGCCGYYSGSSPACQAPIFNRECPTAHFNAIRRVGAICRGGLWPPAFIQFVSVYCGRPQAAPT